MQAVAEQRRKSKEKKEANKEKSLVVQKVGLSVAGEGGARGAEGGAAVRSDLFGAVMPILPEEPACCDHILLAAVFQIAAIINRMGPSP